MPQTTRTKIDHVTDRVQFRATFSPTCGLFRPSATKQALSNVGSLGSIKKCWSLRRAPLSFKCAYYYYDIFIYIIIIIIIIICKDFVCC